MRLNWVKRISPEIPANLSEETKDAPCADNEQIENH